MIQGCAISYTSCKACHVGHEVTIQKNSSTHFEFFSQTHGKGIEQVKSILADQQKTSNWSDNSLQICPNTTQMRKMFFVTVESIALWPLQSKQSMQA